MDKLPVPNILNWMTFFPFLKDGFVVCYNRGKSNDLPPRLFKESMTDTTKLSPFERILLGLDQPVDGAAAPLRRGEPCPQCAAGLLDYNGLLQLECPVCGFVNAEGGGCT